MEWMFCFGSNFGLEGKNRTKELQERLFDTRNLKASKYKKREGNQSVKWESVCFPSFFLNLSEE
jgi:hypothetical protein